jgi:hypothetical protein
MELSRAFELEYCIIFDWYDGILSAMIRTPKRGWEYIEIAWAGNDLERRIYRTWSASDDRVQTFRDAAGDHLSSLPGGGMAHGFDEEFSELINRFVESLKDNASEPSKWLFATPVLKQGDWFEPVGELRMEGKLLRDDSRVFGRFCEWTIC